MADSSYNAEVKNIEQFLNLQKPCSSPAKTSARPITVSEDSIDPANYMAPRFLKKNKAKVEGFSFCSFCLYEMSFIIHLVFLWNSEFKTIFILI